MLVSSKLEELINEYISSLVSNFKVTATNSTPSSTPMFYHNSILYDM